MSAKVLVRGVQVRPGVILLFRLLAPGGMSPQLTALWMRALASLFLFAAVTLGAGAHRSTAKLFGELFASDANDLLGLRVYKVPENPAPINM